jgi:pyruvate formate lyase activating enzyme
MVDNHMSDVPLHFSRFFPQYRMKDISPTPVSTLRKARQTALEEGISHVYLGNI